MTAVGVTTGLRRIDCFKVDELTSKQVNTKLTS